MIEGYYPERPSDYLKIELELRKRRNPHYSIRAFARDLDLSPSHLSEFLSGKASLSIKKASELSGRLRLSADQSEHWTDLISLGSKGSEKRQRAKIRVHKRIKENKTQVSLDTFKVIADWYHFAILAFLGVNSKYSVKQLSDHLRVSELQVRNALKRLKKMGLVEKNEGGLKPSANASFAGDSIPSDAIRESQRQVLSKAAESLEAHSMDQRVNQSLFFSVPRKNLPELKEALKKRVLETISEFSDGDPQAEDSVQALTWHLFPLENGVETK